MCDITSNFKDLTKFDSEIHEIDTSHSKLLFIQFLYAFQVQSYARLK